MVRLCTQIMYYRAWSDYVLDCMFRLCFTEHGQIMYYSAWSNCLLYDIGLLQYMQGYVRLDLVQVSFHLFTSDCVTKIA